MLEKFSPDELIRYSMLDDTTTDLIEQTRLDTIDETMENCDKNCQALIDVQSDRDKYSKQLKYIAMLRDAFHTEIENILILHFWDKKRLYKRELHKNGLPAHASEALYLFLQSLDDRLLDLSCDTFF